MTRILDYTIFCFICLVLFSPLWLPPVLVVIGLWAMI